MKFRLGLTFGLLLVSATVFAKDSNIMRGGLGFIFQDHNSFANPGQYAVSHGVGVQASYQRPSKDTDPVSGFPNPQIGGLSAVFGNGTFGLGAGVTRIAQDVIKNTNNFGDVLTAGGGIAIAKERITLGASYSRDISPAATGAGQLLATATLQSPGRKGPALAVGYTTTLNSPTKKQGVKGGLGYSFMNGTALEANVSFNDTNNFSDYNLSAYLNAMKGAGYASFGWIYDGVAKNHSAAGRLGAVLGQHFDISLVGSFAFVSNTAFYYGGTARLTF